jgi:hypothetical protein
VAPHLALLLQGFVPIGINSKTDVVRKKRGEIDAGLSAENATPLAQQDISQNGFKRLYQAADTYSRVLGYIASKDFKKEPLLSRNRKDERQKSLVKRTIMKICNS